MVIDKFTMSAMTGGYVAILSFNRWVGIDSNLHDLLADLLTKVAISGSLIDMTRYNRAQPGTYLCVYSVRRNHVG